MLDCWYRNEPSTQRGKVAGNEGAAPQIDVLVNTNVNLFCEGSHILFDRRNKQSFEGKQGRGVESMEQQPNRAVITKHATQIYRTREKRAGHPAPHRLRVRQPSTRTQEWDCVRAGRQLRATLPKTARMRELYLVHVVLNACW